MKTNTVFAILLFFSFFSVFGQENVQPNEKVKSGGSNNEIRKTDLKQNEITETRSNPIDLSYSFKMSDGSVTTCFGQFFDSGGPSGSYSANENSTYTLQSGTEGAHLVLRFVEFVLNDGDELTVYDGSTAEAKVIGTFSKSNPMPFELKSTGGSLTFVFTSDTQGNGPGWRASIACYIGEKKTLKTDDKTPSVRLIYAIDGIKSESDAKLIEEILGKNEYILSTTVDVKKNTVIVNAMAESYKDAIMEQLLSSEEILGYKISVALTEIIQPKPLK